MYKGRVILISALWALVFCVIIGRLYQIQIASTHSFSKEKADLKERAYDAQSREILLKSGRGKILDRTGKAWVGENKDRLLLFPQKRQQLQRKKKSLEKLAHIIGYSHNNLERLLSRIEYPMILGKESGQELVLNNQQKQQIKKLHLSGVMIVKTDNRFSYPRTASQVLGRVIRNPFFVQEKYAKGLAQGRYSLQSRIGYSGLEESFESFLHGSTEKILAYLQTRKGQPLTGAKLKVVEKEEKKKSDPFTVVTTLDQELQAQVEQLLQQYHVKDGAVVVQEIQTGDVLALSSAPLVDVVQPKEENPWDNRALMEATPGSIFKIVVALAALEEGIVHAKTPYYCKGELDHYHLKDEKKGGHGHETFGEAFAQSCNVMMGSVANKLSGERLEEYAKRLGLGQKIIWSGKVFNQPMQQMLQEHTGLIFASQKDKKDAGAVTQSGIGQRGVKITPLQAANMVTALFHQGKALSPRLVSEIRDASGKVAFRFPIKMLSTSKPLHQKTTKRVQEMMEMVVNEGTAKSIKKSSWPLAGKTGTAQIGKKNDRYNKWMIGYGPTTKPRYSVSVLIGDTANSDDVRAKKIFARTMEIVKLLEEQRNKQDKKSSHIPKKLPNAILKRR